MLVVSARPSFAKNFLIIGILYLFAAVSISPSSIHLLLRDLIVELEKSELNS
jgi:hypothetical protein